MRSPASAQDWAFVVWKYSGRRRPAPASGLAIWIFSLTSEIFPPGSTPTPTFSFATHWGSCSTSRSILSLQPTSATPISGSAWSRRRPCFMRLEARKYLFDIRQAADSIAAFCAGKTFEQGAVLAGDSGDQRDLGVFHDVEHCSVRRICPPVRGPTRQRRTGDLPPSAQLRQLPHAILQRQRFDLLAEGKARRSRVDHEQAVQSEIGERGGQRFGHGRRISVFHLDPDAPAAQEKQQIQLGPGLRAPVVGLAGAGLEQYLLDGEGLP